MHFLFISIKKKCFNKSHIMNKITVNRCCYTIIYTITDMARQIRLHFFYKQLYCHFSTVFNGNTHIYGISTMCFCSCAWYSQNRNIDMLDCVLKKEIPNFYFYNFEWISFETWCIYRYRVIRQMWNELSLDIVHV